MAETNTRARRSLKPASLTQNSDDQPEKLDLTAFAPKQISDVVKDSGPNPEELRAFSEDHGFTARTKTQNPASPKKSKPAAAQSDPAPVSTGRRFGRPRSKVQRSIQCNTRVQQITMDELLWYFEAEGWSYAQVLEHGLDALRKEREGQGLPVYPG